MWLCTFVFMASASVVYGKTEDTGVLQQATATAIGRSADDIMEMLLHLHERADLNKDGAIDENELNIWVRKLYLANNKMIVKAEMEYIDKDNDLKANWEELFAAMIDPEEGGDLAKKKEALKKRMKIADKDADGQLDVEELRLLLHPGEVPELLQVETDDIIASHDTDKDGKLSWDEFYQQNKRSDEFEKATLRKEWDDYNLNHDDWLDAEEIKMALSEPKPSEIRERVEDCRTASDRITTDELINNWHRWARSSFCEKGKLLRAPEDFPLDPPLPYKNVPGVEDEMDLSESEGEDEDDFDADNIKDEL